jgi:hypothetical protein
MDRQVMPGEVDVAPDRRPPEHNAAEGGARHRRCAFFMAERSAAKRSIGRSVAPAWRRGLARQQRRAPIRAWARAASRIGPRPVSLCAGGQTYLSHPGR